jgi:hypothetical protein
MPDVHGLVKAVLSTLGEEILGIRYNWEFSHSLEGPPSTPLFGEQRRGEVARQKSQCQRRLYKAAMTMEKRHRPEAVIVRRRLTATAKKAGRPFGDRACEAPPSMAWV